MRIGEPVSQEPVAQRQLLFIMIMIMIMIIHYNYDCGNINLYIGAGEGKYLGTRSIILCTWVHRYVHR